MEQTIKLEISKDEAGQLSDVLDQCVKVLRESNEYGARMAVEIAQLKAETRAMLKHLGEQLNVETGL